MYNFSEIEIRETSETKRRGTNVSVTRTVIARTSNEFDDAFMKAAGDAARISLPDAETRVKGDLEKWKSVSDIVLPLIPTIIEVLSPLIETAHKLGIWMFATDLAPTCDSRTAYVPVPTSVQGEVSENGKDTNISASAFVSSRRLKEKVSIQWGLLINDARISEIISSIDIDLSDGRESIFITLADGWTVFIMTKDHGHAYVHPNFDLHFHESHTVSLEDISR